MIILLYRKYILKPHMTDEMSRFIFKFEKHPGFFRPLVAQQPWSWACPYFQAFPSLRVFLAARQIPRPALVTQNVWQQQKKDFPDKNRQSYEYESFLSQQTNIALY